MEAKGVALLQRLSGNGGLKEAALPRQSNANVLKRGQVYFWLFGTVNSKNNPGPFSESVLYSTLFYGK